MNNSVKIINYPNSLQYSYIEMNNMISTSIAFFINAGSKYEDPKNYGIFHFLEHMLFKGTKKRPKASIIAKELDKIGGIYNAATSKNYTVFHIKINHNNALKALEIVSDLILNSLIRSKDVESEKKVVLEELNHTMDELTNLNLELISFLLFQNTPLEHSIIGSIEQIKQYHPTDVKKYYQQYYKIDNIALSIAGKIDPEIHTFVKKNLTFPTSTKTNIDVIKFNQKLDEKYYHNTFTDNSKQFILQNKSKALILQKKQISQMNVIIGFPTLGIHSEMKYILDFLDILLAGNMSSILFLKLRKLGLVYDISSTTLYYKKNGIFLIMFSTEQNDWLDVFKIIIQELHKLKINLLSNKLINDTLDYIKSSIELDTENTMNIALHYGIQQILQIKPILSFNDIISKKINNKNITPKRVKEICNKIFLADKMHISVISGDSPSNIRKDLNKLFKTVSL